MEQSNKHHYGLYNQGATCYLNSVLQVLFKTTENHDRLDPKLQPDRQLRNIFEGLKTTECRTHNITTTFGIENVYQQADAAECLEMILNNISSHASEVFQVMLRYTTKCSKDHSIKNETLAFWTLQLSLKDTHDATYSVENSIKRMFQTKSLSGDNKVYCNDCSNKTEATYGCEMVKPPKVLILLLKRFDFDYNTMSHFKSNCCVDVPLTLQIKNKTYKLYGMVNHTGSLYGGHYTAILSNEDETWYECNDARVYKVREQPFAKTGTYHSRSVYLLTYRESQLSREENSEGLADNVVHKTDETSNVDEPNQDEVECKEGVGERNADNAKKSPDINMKTATECDRHAETNSEDLMDEVKEEQDETRREEAECKENVGERDTDDKERHGEPSEEDEKQMIKKQKEEDSSHQTGDKEGEVESVKNDKSVKETSPDINMKSGENSATLSDVKNRGDEEAQENLSINADSAHFSITHGNTTSKSEDLKGIKVDEASVSAGEESKSSSEPRLDEETKPEKQKQKATECYIPVDTNSGILMDEVKEEQDEDIIPEELKEGEVRILMEPSRECSRSKAKSVQCSPWWFVLVALFVILGLTLLILFSVKLI